MPNTRRQASTEPASPQPAADGDELLWSVLELMVYVSSDRSGDPGRCGASTLALSQLIDLNILEFHTLLNPFSNSLNPQGTIVI